MELTYKVIKNYLVEDEQREDKLWCKFQIEDKELISEVAIHFDEALENALEQHINSLAGRMRSRMVGVLRKAVGKKKIESEDSDAPTFEKASRKEREHAVVAAFQAIMNEIIYDETAGKWHLATDFSEFEQKIRRNPLVEAYDKRLMSRMLVEMARADGKIEEEERLFFNHFLNEQTGRLGDLMRAPYLREEECQKVAPKHRPTIFMIVAAVALTDNELAASEQKKLKQFATMFELDNQQQEELLKVAQIYTIEAAVKVKKEALTEAKLYILADKIGVSRTEAAAIKERVLER